MSGAPGCLGRGGGSRQLDRSSRGKGQPAEREGGDTERGCSALQKSREMGEAKVMNTAAGAAPKGARARPGNPHTPDPGGGGAGESRAKQTRNMG